MFSFDAKVRDTVTGYEGTVTAKVTYRDREPSYLVESVDTTGRPVEWWVTETRLQYAHISHIYNGNPPF